MVEQAFHLDSVFGSLADATRRDILRRVSKQSLAVGEIASAYNMSLAAISKHLRVLEKAQLILKRRQGKQQIVELSPAAVKDASAFLKQYEQMWDQRFDALERLLVDEQKKEK